MKKYVIKNGAFFINLYKKAAKCLIFAHTVIFFNFIVDTITSNSIIPPHLPRQVNKQDGRLAQLGEHRPYKARVTGSSPVASTIFLITITYPSMS
jgi:hypothetical protein